MTKAFRDFLKRLKNDPKGWVFFKLFIAILLLCAFLPFLVNESPLLIRYQGKFYAPMTTAYTERDFGGILPVKVDFHEARIRQRIENEGWIIWSIIPHSSWSVDYSLKNSGPHKPSKQHWLGTDTHGRDLLARLLYALRFTLFFSLLLTTLSSVLGFCIGAVQGYFGGRVDMVLQRFVEIWFSVPVLFLLIALASLVSLTFSTMLLVLTLFKWRSIVPLVRMLFLRARESPYVEAAKALGVSKRSIVFKHILPNVIFAPLARIPFMVMAGVSILTTLDFFGFSLPFPMLTFGEILVQGKNNLHAPWIVCGAIGFLLSVLLVLIFLGESFQKIFLFKKRSGECS